MRHIVTARFRQGDIDILYWVQPDGRVYVAVRKTVHLSEKFTVIKGLYEEMLL